MQRLIAVISLLRYVFSLLGYVTLSIGLDDTLLDISIEALLLD